MDQVRAVFLVPDTPTKYPLQPDSFLKIAQRVVRSYGVHNNAFMVYVMLYLPTCKI